MEDIASPLPFFPPFRSFSPSIYLCERTAKIRSSSQFPVIHSIPFSLKNLVSHPITSSAISIFFGVNKFIYLGRV